MTRNEEIIRKLDSLKGVFINNHRWQITKDGAWRELRDQCACPRTNFNVDMHTRDLCEHYAGDHMFKGDKLCEGFAKYMADCVFGSYPESNMELWKAYSTADEECNGKIVGSDGSLWKKYTKSSLSQITLEPGDVILAANDSGMEHAAIIHTVEGDTVTVGQCLLEVIRWGTFNSMRRYSSAKELMKCACVVYKAPKTRIVSFDAMGGHLAQTQREYSLCEEYGSLPVPTRSGYTFIGWFPSKDSECEQHTVHTVVNFVGANTLYARWAKKYYITYRDRYLAMKAGYNYPFNGAGIALHRGTPRDAWYISAADGARAIRCENDTEYGLSTVCADNCLAVTAHVTAGNDADCLVNVRFLNNECRFCRFQLNNTNLYLTAHDDGRVCWEERTKGREAQEIFCVTPA